MEVDECIMLFYFNRGLAEKVRSISVYANEYKLTEIKADGLRIEDSMARPKVPLDFTDEELKDPWVTIRPQYAATFRVTFSEQTPKRFLRAYEVTD